MADTSLEHDPKQGQLVIASPQSADDIRQVSTTMRRRCLLILGVSSVVMTVAGLLALTTKPTYQSYMQILISSHLNGGVQANNVENADSGPGDPNFEAMDYNAQMKLMLSSMLIQKAVDMLRDNYPDITVEDIKGNKGKQRPLVVTKLEDETGRNQVRDQVLEVSFKADDPLKTQKVLQALEKVYQEYNAEEQKERLFKGLSFFKDRLPKVKNEVAQAEQNLNQFRKRNNLLDPEIQGKILLESLADTKKQLRITRAQIQDAKARYNYLQKELTSSTQKELASSTPKEPVSSRVNQSPHTQILLDQIHNTELALAREQQRYTDNSPVVKTLIQQRQTQMALLREEVGRSQGTPNTLTLLAVSSRMDKFPNSSELPTGVPSTVQAPFSKQVSNDTLSNSKNHSAQVSSKLKEDLMNLETTTLGLSANEKSLVESEQQILSELGKYQNLMAEYKHLVPEVENNRKALEQLVAAQHSMELKIAAGGFDWQVLEEPQQGIYLGSSRLLFLLGGLAIGPILGIAAAVLRESSNDTIYSPQVLQKLTNLQLLGVIPKLPQQLRKKKLFNLPLGWRRSPVDDDKALDIDTCLPCHETLDIAYQNIQILEFPLTCKCLMLTSALPGEGKSTVALGLAVSAAHMHRRVLLIDANLRQPSLHKMLELSNDWGLSLLLIDEINTDLKEYIQPIHPTIDVLTAGPTPDDPVKLLSSGRMKELLDLFEQTYDLVLIDTPSILGTVDARLLACICHEIAIVSRIGQVTKTELTQATEILRNSKLNVIGMIANGASHCP